MKRLRADLLDLRNGRPGRRFRDSHRRNHKKQGKKGLFGRSMRGIFGLVLVLIGLFFMAVPGPGIPVLLLGLVLLATVSSRTARLLDRAEVFLRLAWEAAWTAWQSASPTVRRLLLILAAAGFIAFGLGVLRIAAAYI